MFDEMEVKSGAPVVQVGMRSSIRKTADETPQSKMASEPVRAHAVGSLNQEEKTDSSTVPLSDNERIDLADKCYGTDRLLEAARLLTNVEDKTLLLDNHRRILETAATFEQTVATLTSPPSEGWTKQGESHDRRDTIIYYRLDGPSKTRLTARIETPIEQSLLVPLLSVFNETNLYKSWMPQFKKPFKLGVSRSEQLRQNGRANQIVAVKADMPWPIHAREAILEAHAVDDIDARGHIVVKMVSRETGEGDGLIPPPEKSVVRIDFDGGILFRKCPTDHPSLKNSKHKLNDGNLVLVCLTMCVDPHMDYVPLSLINWTTRHVIGHMWATLLQVAEDVRDGKRPEHAAVIDTKREFLYDWVDQRVGAMFTIMEEP